MVRVKTSTISEIMGFGFLDGAAWHVNFLAGSITTGFILLFIGYAIEDDKAILSLKTVGNALKRVVKRPKAANK